MKQRKTNTDTKIFENIVMMERYDFLQAVPHLVKHYNKNNVVTLHDKNSVGFLLSGIGILTRITVHGDEFPPKFISPFHVIDYRYEDGDDRYEVIVCQDSEIIWFDRDPFYDYLNQHLKFYKVLFLCEVRERRFIDRFNEAASIQLGKDKVYEVMKWLGSVYGSTTFVIPTTITRLGHIIGLSRDRLKESLNALEEEGKLKQSSTYRIKLLD